MKDIKSIKDLVKHNLCTGCGVCGGICPRNAIELEEGRALVLYPKINENCDDCGLCISICPGLSCFGENETCLDNYGIRESWLAYANDGGLRNNGQSGGSISALLIYALESKLCTGVIVTSEQVENPLKKRTFIARNRQEVLSAAKSKYCPVDWGRALKEILDGDQLIAVGTPCQLQGLRNAQRLIEKKLNAEIKLYFGVVCDGIMNYGFQDFILRHLKTKSPLVEFVYKDKEFGWPGDLKIQTISETIFLPEYI